MSLRQSWTVTVPAGDLVLCVKRKLEALDKDIANVQHLIFTAPLFVSLYYGKEIDILKSRREDYSNRLLLLQAMDPAAKLALDADDCGYFGIDALQNDNP